MEVGISVVTKTFEFGTSQLPGMLSIPRDAEGVVLFAHGSGSNRLSPRNRSVSDTLLQFGFATFLLDLLHEQEAGDQQKVFDIELLADRLIEAIDWITTSVITRNMKIGLFGASTGAAATLVAAALRIQSVGAIVSRGGRPDLAGSYLQNVEAPTLLIVGEQDEPVLQINKKALDIMHCPKRLVTIAGATHLFPKAGALEEVAQLTKEWFRTQLVGDSTRLVRK
ncbi:MAG: dienelactone hydrolase family protein [Planctomycetes bacterium]|nr:dienelactone hydrolase family protein [Planctomycetota bacterium]